ncbi:unnamed protein product [Symbiodinium sp. CCMP2592]|nr:unnamed protein product [Symbiodinium sp. CCMP2592]
MSLRFQSFQPSWYSFLAVTTLLAWLLGVVFGNLNYAATTDPFSQYVNMDVLPEVSPAQWDGEAAMSVGRVYFGKESTLDVRRSMAFKNVDTYCVAPVSVLQGGVVLPLETYDFWAIGMDCCSVNAADFHCGEVGNSKAHSGLRLLDDRQRSFYRLAVEQAEAAYFIKARHPVFFYWVEDATAEMDSFRNDGYKYFLIGMLSHFLYQLLCVLLAIAAFSKWGLRLDPLLCSGHADGTEASARAGYMALCLGRRCATDFRDGKDTWRWRTPAVDPGSTTNPLARPGTGNRRGDDNAKDRTTKTATKPPSSRSRKHFLDAFMIRGRGRLLNIVLHHAYLLHHELTAALILDRLEKTIHPRDGTPRHTRRRAAAAASLAIAWYMPRREAALLLYTSLTGESEAELEHAVPKRKYLADLEELNRYPGEGFAPSDRTLEYQERAWDLYHGRSTEEKTLENIAAEAPVKVNELFLGSFYSSTVWRQQGETMQQYIVRREQDFKRLELRMCFLLHRRRWRSWHDYDFKNIGPRSTPKRNGKTRSFGYAAAEEDYDTTEDPEAYVADYHEHYDDVPEAPRSQAYPFKAQGEIGFEQKARCQEELPEAGQGSEAPNKKPLASFYVLQEAVDGRSSSSRPALREDSRQRLLTWSRRRAHSSTNTDLEHASYNGGHEKKFYRSGNAHTRGVRCKDDLCPPKVELPIFPELGPEDADILVPLPYDRRTALRLGEFQNGSEPPPEEPRRINGIDPGSMGLTWTKSSATTMAWLFSRAGSQMIVRITKTILLCGVPRYDGEDFLSRQVVQGKVRVSKQPPCGKTWMKQLFAAHTELSILCVLAGMAIGVPLDITGTGWNPTTRAGLQQVHNDLKKEDPYQIVITASFCDLSQPAMITSSSSATRSPLSLVNKVELYESGAIVAVDTDHLHGQPTATILTTMLVAEGMLSDTGDKAVYDTLVQQALVEATATDNIEVVLADQFNAPPVYIRPDLQVQAPQPIDDGRAAGASPQHHREREKKELAKGNTGDPQDTRRSERDFPAKHHLQLDTFYAKDIQSILYSFLNIIDEATGFQVVSARQSVPQASGAILKHFLFSWSSWAGLPQSIQVDLGKEYMADFANYLKEIFVKTVHDMQISGLKDAQMATGIVTQCRNYFPRTSGYSPIQWVLGVPQTRLPGSLLDDAETERLEVLEVAEDPTSAMARSLGIREAAKVAQIRADTDDRVRRALLRKSTPTGASRTYRWHGCAGVIGVELPNQRRTEYPEPATDGDELLAAHSVPQGALEPPYARGAHNFAAPATIINTSSEPTEQPEQPQGEPQQVQPQLPEIVLAPAAAPSQAPPAVRSPVFNDLNRLDGYHPVRRARTGDAQGPPDDRPYFVESDLWHHPDLPQRLLERSLQTLAVENGYLSETTEDEEEYVFPEKCPAETFMTGPQGVELVAKVRCSGSGKALGGAGEAEFPFEAKSRLVVQGCQEDPHDIRSDSPTASLLAFNLVCSIATMMGWVITACDASTAYLQSHGISRLLLLRAPRPPPPGVSPFDLFRARGSIYGTKDAGRAWWRKLWRTLKKHGWQMSEVEAALFYLFDGMGLLGVMISHVDDLYSGGEGKTYNDTISEMEVELHLKIKKGEFRFCGKNVAQREGCIFLEQYDAIEGVDYMVLEASRRKQLNAPLSEQEKSLFRGLIGQMGWITRQKAVKMLKESSDAMWCFRASDLSLDNAMVFWKSQTGYLIGFTTPEIHEGKKVPIHVIETHSGSIKRVCRSTLAAEANGFLAGVEAAEYLRALLMEVRFPNISLRDLENHFLKAKIACFTDAKILVAQVKELLGEDEYEDQGSAFAHWVDTSQMLADVLAEQGCERGPLLEALYSGEWMAVCMDVGAAMRVASNRTNSLLAFAESKLERRKPLMPLARAGFNFPPGLAIGSRISEDALCSRQGGGMTRRSWEDLDLEVFSEEQLKETCLRLEGRVRMLRSFLADLHRENATLRRQRAMLSDRLGEMEDSLCAAAAAASGDDGEELLEQSPDGELSYWALGPLQHAEGGDCIDWGGAGPRQQRLLAVQRLSESSAEAKTQELELRRCQAQEEQLRMEVCEHQLSRAQMEQDSADRLQRLTAREELELRRCQEQEGQLRVEAGIGRATDADAKGQLVYRFHRIIALCFLLCCSSICQSAAVAAFSWADGQSSFSVRPRGGGAAPEYLFHFGGKEEQRRREQRAFERGGREEQSAGAGFSLGAGFFGSGIMQANGGDGSGLPDGQPQQQGAAPSQASAAGAAQPNQQQQAEQFVDKIVKQRLDQAFSSVFGKLIESSERAAKAAEQQAGTQRTDNLIRSLKVDTWKPQSREEELRTWREWWFGLSNCLIANDAAYEDDLKNIDQETEVDHALLPDEMVQRSQKLYGLLCSLLKGRPLLLVRGLEKTKSGYEAVRLLRSEMEPREKARSLALLRQLASWRFDGPGGLHEKLIQYEEALRAYETASGKEFPKDLVLATVLTGLREPLRSQVQLRMGPTTAYSELREWILQYESLNTPWGTAAPGQPKGGGGGGRQYDDGGQQPMEVDRIWGGYGYGKGKAKDGKSKTKARWNQWASAGWNDPEGCRICGQRGHWKWECPLAAKGKGAKGPKGKVHQVEQVPSSAASVAPSTASTTLPSSASTYRGTAATVNLVEAFVSTPPGCRVTEVFDITEIDETGAPVYRMDATDDDDDWTLVPGLAALSPEAAEASNEEESVARVCAVTAGVEVDVIIDSGADISVAPVRLSSVGQSAKVAEMGVDFGVPRRKANNGEGEHRVGIRLRRNTLMITAMVSAISSAAPPAGVRAFSSFDDLGRLPEPLEEVAARPGWHILGNGLPALVAHRVTELDLEQNLWDMEAPVVPAERGTDDEGAGAGLEVGDLEAMAVDGRPVEDAPANGDEELEGVALSVETPLKTLRGLCDKLGLSRSGGKDKVLKRLRMQREVLEQRMTAEVARKMFLEQNREPDMPKADEQEVSSTSQPDPVIQIDYGYGFTKQKHEGAEVKMSPMTPGPSPSGLTLFAAESTTGWIVALPILEKGAGSLKRVTENLTRLSLQISPSEPVTVQGDPEPAVKQALGAVKSCRARLGLVTNTQLIEKGSHASNGRVEKAIDTIRRSGLTLRCHLEGRIKAKIEGHNHIFAWVNRHAAFLHNRFANGGRGSPPFEIMFGRRYRGKLLPFGEKCIFYKGSKHKADVQWERGIWLGINERNGSHILGTTAGVTESRSIRRLPEPEQWDAEMVLSMKGLPWSYMGTARRKRPLYSSLGTRVPLLPDSATLEEIAKAAGRAAAESIAAATPVPAVGTPVPGRPVSEAGSDPPTSSSSSSGSSQGSPGPMRATGAPAEAGQSEQRQQQPNTQQESTGQSHPSGTRPEQRREQQQQPNTQQESAGQSHPSGPAAMSDVGRPPVAREAPQPEATTPKRPRLLLDRPGGATGSPAASTPSALYPPAYAGVSRAGINMVHGDILPEELSDFGAWGDEVIDTMVEESELAGEYSEPWWDEEGDAPPALSEGDLRVVDAEADQKEITRLIQMGVARWPHEGEDVSGYQTLTTKVVRDWRKRPGWVRRSRLVGREFRTMAAYTQELFAPASTLATVHGFISWALSKNLQLTTVDVKDAYLNVPQPSPVTIEVEKAMFGNSEPGTVTLVLDRLLPGQRIGAAAWYGFAKDKLEQASLEGYTKEPTLFRSTKEGSDTAMILHADDGLLASTAKGRQEFEEKFGSAVTLQVSEPLVEDGDTIEFLKRKYVKTPEGVAVYSNPKYLALGSKVKPRDSPVDNSFLEQDASKELGPAEAKVYKESVGRLLYLAHSRPDVQYAVCILSSKMSCPTALAMKWLYRVVGYLVATPEIGFTIRPLRNGSSFSYAGGELLCEKSGPFKVVLESITDADWGGCKRTRRSRSSMQFYAGGSVIGSAVRTQRSIALSSAESEFLAILGGACEVLYLRDCIAFLGKDEFEVEVVCRSDSASARAITQRLGCGRVRHLHAGWLWIQASVKAQELCVSPIAGALNPADLGTKPLCGNRIRELLYTMNAVEPSGEPYGKSDKEAADEKRAFSKALKAFSDSGARVSNVKALIPLVLMLSQVPGAQGLGLAGASFTDDELAQLMVTLVIGAVVVFVFWGIPFAAYKLLKWSLGLIFRSRGTATTGTQTEPEEEERDQQRTQAVQANRGMSKEERLFSEEYVRRCTELEALFAEKCRKEEACWRELAELRDENRRQREAFERLRARRAPETVHVAMSTSPGYLMVNSLSAASLLSVACLRVAGFCHERHELLKNVCLRIRKLPVAWHVGIKIMVRDVTGDVERMPISVSRWELYKTDSN